MRWWRFALGGALLAWVLVTAYRRARERDRRLAPAVLLVGAAIAMFAAAALVPRPPMTITLAAALVVGSIAALAGAIAVVLSKGFGE
jgi:uncharacterized membrane protein